MASNPAPAGNGDLMSRALREAFYAGIIKGKFSYLSPEAAQGQDVDARTDIFAVGIILWELLTGQRLFLGETDFQTVKKVQEGRVPPMTAFNPRITKELEEIVQKSLARDPAERYLTARDLGKDLARHLYKIGVPVSSFDVESLVQGTMREIKKTRAPQVSIIDKLIEEALLEFTSLKDDEKPASSGTFSIFRIRLMRPNSNCISTG